MRTKGFASERAHVRLTLLARAHDGWNPGDGPAGCRLSRTRERNPYCSAPGNIHTLATFNAKAYLQNLTPFYYNKYIYFFQLEKSALVFLLEEIF